MNIIDNPSNLNRHLVFRGLERPNNVKTGRWVALYLYEPVSDQPKNLTFTIDSVDSAAEQLTFTGTVDTDDQSYRATVNLFRRCPWNDTVVLIPTTPTT